MNMFFMLSFIYLEFFKGPRDITTSSPSGLIPEMDRYSKVCTYDVGMCTSLTSLSLPPHAVNGRTMLGDRFYQLGTFRSADNTMLSLHLLIHVTII